MTIRPSDDTPEFAACPTCGLYQLIRNYCPTCGHKFHAADFDHRKKGEDIVCKATQKARESIAASRQDG